MKRARGLTPKATPEATIAKLAGRHHLHSCAECGATFSCNCATPAVNGRCQGCRTAHGRTRSDHNRDPVDCCTTNNLALITRADVIGLYQLAGPGPWWQCRTCFRAHGRHIVKGLGHE